jgi:FkbM family methyltransferase
MNTMENHKRDSALKGKFFNQEEFVVDLIEDKKTKLLLRPGTSDKAMLNDCVKKDYKLVDCKDQIVLDLGANIGGFMYRAARDGAKQVISYEPEPNNYDMLKLNHAQIATQFPNVDLISINAAVYNVAGMMKLSIRPGNNASCSCSITRSILKKGMSVDVKVEALHTILEKYKPTFIKIDVEGAEYGIFEETIPDNVKRIAFEFHGNQKKMFDLLKHIQVKSVNNPWTVVEYNEIKGFGSIKLNKLPQVHTATGYITRK